VFREQCYYRGQSGQLRRKEGGKGEKGVRSAKSKGIKYEDEVEEERERIEGGECGAKLPWGRDRGNGGIGTLF